MKSGKQKRLELQASKKRRLEKKELLLRRKNQKDEEAKTAPCNASLLAPNHSISDPLFVTRGFYKDELFRCKDCKEEGIWTATRQKWWYEVAKGDVWTTAVRCNSCRRKERERKANARRVHLEGIARKGG